MIGGLSAGFNASERCRAERESPGKETVVESYGFPLLLSRKAHVGVRVAVDSSACSRSPAPDATFGAHSILDFLPPPEEIHEESPDGARHRHRGLRRRLRRVRRVATAPEVRYSGAGHRGLGRLGRDRAWP